jgi:FKBP-type peptidyl-prolyl cis-trans isomerase
MSRRLLLSFCLVLPLANAEQAAPASPHDYAYSLGASLGERLRQEMPDLQIKALLEGLQQAYQNKPLALDDARIRQILSEHDAAPDTTDGQASTAKALSAERSFLQREKAKPGVRELADGILLSVISPGDGALPKPDGQVQVRYVGRLPDGTVFDQNQQPQWLRLDNVITGWRTALQQMPVGAKWRVVIPSAQAYGAEGAGDVIPPYTPLTFEIELLGVGD